MSDNSTLVWAEEMEHRIIADLQDEMSRRFDQTHDDFRELGR